MAISHANLLEQKELFLQEKISTPRGLVQDTTMWLSFSYVKYNVEIYYMTRLVQKANT